MSLPTVVSTSNACGWTRRVQIGNAPAEREKNTARASALELSVRDYAKNNQVVVNHAVGNINVSFFHDNQPTRFSAHRRFSISITLISVSLISNTMLC